MNDRTPAQDIAPGLSVAPNGGRGLSLARASRRMIRPDRLALAISRVLRYAAADFWQAIADARAWLDERLADSCNGPGDS